MSTYKINEVIKLMAKSGYCLDLLNIAEVTKFGYSRGFSLTENEAEEIINEVKELTKSSTSSFFP